MRLGVSSHCKEFASEAVQAETPVGRAMVSSRSVESHGEEPLQAEDLVTAG